MWTVVTKRVIRTGVQIVKQISNFADDLGESLLEAKKVCSDQDQKNLKSLKIAILGMPNVGKSTLVNHLIGRPVCATSSKIHTTRHKAAAIFCTDDTQLIFLDTPGMVAKHDFKRYKLEDSFKEDVYNSLNEADMIGVIQDVSRAIAREAIHSNIIDMLKLAKPETKSILILNKVDKLKDKAVLLHSVNKLASKKMWPHFSDIFMISALTGNGVEDLRNYFLDSAKYGSWYYDKNSISDQPSDTIITEIVKGTVLNELPQEIPYLINIHVDTINYCEDGSISVIANVNCPSTRIARLVIGRSGERIKKIAKEGEQLLCKVFLTTVRLKVVVPIKEEKETDSHKITGKAKTVANIAKS